MYQKGDRQSLENLCGIDPLVRIFCELTEYETTSDEHSRNVPSTVGQLRLGTALLGRINSMGIECEQDSLGIVTARVKASEGYEDCRRLCLLAHLDTSPDASGANVSPALVRNYQGGGIELANGLIIDENICPTLETHIGDDIIVTDGTTLLGADDKAGVAVLVRLLYELVSDPSFKHGPVTVVFSVDEEIGTSSSHIDLKKVDCDFGVTVDGSELGELDVATFNAEGASFSIKGRSVHTGSAYKALVNAVTVGCEFLSMLPSSERPETTRDKEGFYHAYSFKGSTGEAEFSMIIRDFSKEGLKARIAYLDSLVALFNQRLGYEAVSWSHHHQYSNFADVLKERPEILNLCRQAFTDAGVEIKESWVRGGTDGSNLSNAGLPCPNIFCGALNCHGPYECLPVNSLRKSYDIVKALVKRVAEKK